MLTIVSPAKSLDFETPSVTEEFSVPVNLDQSQKLINALKKLSKKKLGDLMKLSPKLVDLNHHRYATWHTDFNSSNAKQAALAFNGEVYTGLAAETFDQKDFEFATKHFRILSGLHGLLKPLDLIQPYRLEMGTKISVGKNKNLYEFWKNTIAPEVNELVGVENPVLMNLASNEYFKAIDQKQLKARVITPVFKDLKGDQYKVVMMFAKKMRGAMANYIIKNQINDPELVKGFDVEGYMYSEEMSSENEWVFIR